MTWLQPARMTERAFLRVLIAGFLLVVVFLGAAGFVAVRGTRAIEDDAAQVGREQLDVARLLNEVQAGQNALAEILHQLVALPEPRHREELLRNLNAANQGLARVAESGAGTPEKAMWQDLETAVLEFSDGVRDALRHQGPLPPSALGPLFDRHDQVVRLEQQLLASSERRIATAESRMEVESRQLAANSRVLLGACLALALLCAALTVIFARSSIRRIEWQASELSRVSWHMLQSQESTARRFSHELHDELGQSLAAVKASLTASGLADWNLRRGDCVGLVDHAIANVRELAQLLHPVILDDFGLDAGLRWLTEGFAQRTGIRADYQSTFHARLPEETETHLFRITQEALTNVARHSGATAVTVNLHSSEDKIFLTIEDNGGGIRDGSGSPHLSLGMTGMRARARQVGGEFNLESISPSGLRLDIVVPRGPAEQKNVAQEDTHSVGR